MLDRLYWACHGAEDAYTHRAVLFVGSESYDAPTITVLHGLDALGFRIYTLKPNINSWRVEQVIGHPGLVAVDFVLSNLHWGTRWDHYDRHDLPRPWVLIDGDDDGRLTWREKHAAYTRRYRSMPDRLTASRMMQPYRWMTPLGDYAPDVVFTSQYNGFEAQGHYLPFGMPFPVTDPRIRDKSDATYDVAAIPGTGSKRCQLIDYLTDHDLPGDVWAQNAYGDYTRNNHIDAYIDADDNVHSWHRWRHYPAYWDTLLDAFALIYPGIWDRPQWESRRPWEALAAGCLLIAERPTTRLDGFDWSELAVWYDDVTDLPALCADVTEHREAYDARRKRNLETANRTVAPQAVARYVLATIQREGLA